MRKQNLVQVNLYQNNAYRKDLNLATDMATVLNTRI